MRTLIARAKSCMMAAQQRQKRHYDKNMCCTPDKAYTVDSKMLLSNLNLKVLKTGTRKLATKWVGPFSVTERIGPLAYRLKLPASMTEHDVFHVCYLKPYRDGGRTQLPPVPELRDDEPEFEVERILDHRYSKRRHQRKLEYLLLFTGYGAEHDMWQHDLSNCAEVVEGILGPQTYHATLPCVCMCSIPRQAFKPLYIHPGFTIARPMGCCPVWGMNCMCVCQCVMLTRSALQW